MNEPATMLRLGVAALLLWTSGFDAEAADPTPPREDPGPALRERQDPIIRLSPFNPATLRLAIHDIARDHGDDFTEHQALLDELKSLENTVAAARAASGNRKPWSMDRIQSLNQQLNGFKRRALLSNPDLHDLRILCVKRAWKGPDRPGNLARLGIPTNHECHSSLQRLGYDNELAVFDAARPAKTWKTLHRPPAKGWVGHPDLHWNSDRLLFAATDEKQWNLWEMNIDGTGLRRITREPDDVDCFDACYLPSGKIICASNATGQCVPCWHGTRQKSVANLFTMNADGSDMRRITFDQDHDMHPAVISTGQVIFNRWDYTGINRIFLRPLMIMNPDGTGQRALYGSNSWFPNGLYSARELPGAPSRFLSILSGYHGPGRTGHLVVLDLDQGRHEEHGIVKRISGLGLPLKVEYMDTLTAKTWPKFRSSHPITDKQFLVSGWMSQKSKAIGIYLTDVFDNVVPVYQIKDTALLDPVPVIPRPVPPVIPDQTEPDRNDATVHLQDIYIGPGLAGVPRGTIKNLRVIAYNFGFIGLAGNDKIGVSGPWDAMRIIGTTPVEKDGSAVFKIPANTPLALQALDEEGKAVQLMRTWFSARPGERVSCVGCHEDPGTAPPPVPSVGSTLPPRDLEPWYGPPRGFDFQREVQPVLNKHCASCHDGRDEICDLRSEELVEDYEGRIPGRLDYQRLAEAHRELFQGRVKYTPAYEALAPYIRRVNVGDDVSLLDPGHYHADTSELIQILQKGHHGVSLDDEAWDRLVTWIDMNGPCHGTWNDVFPIEIPDCADQRRAELFTLYGGPPENPELVPDADPYDDTPVETGRLPKPEPISLDDWPFDSTALQTKTRSLDLGEGVSIQLARIPAGRFVMGDVDGQPDELPQAVVEFDQPFWMSTGEITNAQLRRCIPAHDSGFYTKRNLKRTDDHGVSLNDPEQPALRVTWNDAMNFCRWLCDQTKEHATLPTEAQWEYACRAGTDAPLHYGGFDDDFSRFENMADFTFATKGCLGKSLTGHFVIGGDVDYLVAEGVDFADRRFEDFAAMPAPISARQPNPFGLHDMHGNVAEWTLSAYRAYPWRENDGRNDPDARGKRVVRGGSFLDRPQRCRSAARYSYPPWQKIHNVGFRIVITP